MRLEIDAKSTRTAQNRLKPRETARLVIQACVGDECPDTLVFAGFLPRALVAQRIEQKTSNLLVAGSIPAEGASAQ